MSKVYDDYLDKMNDANDMLEEIHKSRYGDDGELDQLRSDLEDAKVKIALLEGTLENWKSIANKDRERADEYKKQMQKAERNNAIGWFVY